MQPEPADLDTRAHTSGLACKSRGNHANGTPKVRPSVKSTHIVCSSKRTAVAEMVMASFLLVPRLSR